MIPDPTHPEPSPTTAGGEATDAVHAARLVLASMGLTPQDLLTTTPPPTGDTPSPAAAPPRTVVPTFAEWIPRVAGQVSPSTARSYQSYWNKIPDEWATRRLDEVTATELRTLVWASRDNALVRATSRGGRGAGENMVAALRCLYRHAEDDNLIDRASNPAYRITKPRRQPSPRFALTNERLTDIHTVAGSTGTDPELDLLLLRLHTESACRRGGALHLRRRDLDTQHCLIRLREKGDTERWQPLSPTLTRHLLAHTDERGGSTPDAALLRYANGRPLTARHYDHLWSRIRTHLPWAEHHQVSTHWLRHTTLKWVERRYGRAVAEAYAGHTPAADTATSVYVKADITEVATALAALTGEPHPLTP